MNDFEIKTFKNANKQLNIIHIISAVYEDAQDSIENHIFYIDSLGINALHVEVYKGDRDPNILTYEEKIQPIINAIKEDKNLNQRLIFTNALNTTDLVQKYTKFLCDRCTTIYEQLVNVSFKGAGIEGEYLIMDYKEEMKENIEQFVQRRIQSNMPAKQICEEFLKQYNIDQEEVNKFFKEKRARLRYDYIKAWG